MVRSEGNMSLKNPVTLSGIDSGTVRLVAQRLNHYATPGPHHSIWSRENRKLGSRFRTPLEAFYFSVFLCADRSLHMDRRPL